MRQTSLTCPLLGEEECAVTGKLNFCWLCLGVRNVEWISNPQDSSKLLLSLSMSLKRRCLETR